MKVVIEISEQDYQAISKGYYYLGNGYMLSDAVKNGVPLTEDVIKEQTHEKDRDRTC